MRAAGPVRTTQALTLVQGPVLHIDQESDRSLRIVASWRSSRNAPTGWISIGAGEIGGRIP